MLHAQGARSGTSIDDRFAAIARDIPEFGGMYLDEDQRTVHVYMASDSTGNTAARGARADAARKHIATAFATDGLRAEHIVFRDATYSFGTLHAWYRPMVPKVLSLPGVHATDIDEVANRLAVHIDRPETEGRVFTELDRLGIPLEAVSIVQRERMRPLSHHLNEPVTPRRGGPVITRLFNNQSGGVVFCTTGFNAKRGKIWGFVTNSHCSQVRAGLDHQNGYPPADFYQSYGAYPAELIGTESLDPAPQACPPGYPTTQKCRYSDSLYATYKPNVTKKLGVLAKTTALTTWDGQTECPGACNTQIDHSAALGLGAGEWAITQRPSVPLLTGLKLNKVGRTTGWTSAAVAWSCIDYVVDNHLMLCQWDASNDLDADPSNNWWRVATGGDSGSPVFRIKDEALRQVEVYGVLWGGSDFGASMGARRFAFSPIEGVERDLGTLNILLPEVVSDVDGDTKADFTVWRPSQAKFYTLNVATGATSSKTFGANGDRPLTGDWDGDRKSDYALWRPSTGDWDVLLSSNGTHLVRNWGTSGDIPLSGDFDNDGKTDFTVWRPSVKRFLTSLSSGGSMNPYFGAETDMPVIGDYNGDGVHDYALFRPSTGVWTIWFSSNGAFLTATWGGAGDIPVSGDFDGDGITDLSVWQPSQQRFLTKISLTGALSVVPFGLATDVPVIVDIDGDHVSDYGLWRPSNGTWDIRRTSGGQVLKRWGANGDIPLPKAPN